jgi:flagellin
MLRIEMALRINTNIAAVRSVRNLEDTDRKLAESLGRLSSGFKINKASDNPAGLVISEQMRGQIVGLNQAIENSELATSMVQTTEGALTEVNNLLIRMRQLALQANNEGGNDHTTLEANQVEITDAIETINRIAQNTQFGNRKLLDGSASVTGEAVGSGLTFVSGTLRTRTSPVAGYAVNVEQVATRAHLEGSTSLSESNIPGLQVTLFEGGRTVQLTGKENETPASFFGRLKRATEETGLAVDVELRGNKLYVQQRDYGSARTFQAGSSVSGVLSSDANVLEAAVPGQDVAGTINGEAADGHGQLLRGLTGSQSTDGLVVRYTGPQKEAGKDVDGGVIYEHSPATGPAGVVNVVNNALDFQIGPNAGQTATVALPNIGPSFLAREVENSSGYASLQDIRVDSARHSRDSIKMIDAAIDQLTLTRGKLGAFQRNGLESNIANLRVTAENLMSAESAIRDTDVAEELTRFTRNKLLFDAGTAAVAQANQLPARVITLIS